MSASDLSNLSDASKDVSGTFEVNKEKYVIYSASNSAVITQLRSNSGTPAPQEKIRFSKSVTPVADEQKHNDVEILDVINSSQAAPILECESSSSERRSSKTHITDYSNVSRLSLLTSGYEGCEKRLLVTFNCGVGSDLRDIDFQQWSKILRHAHCRILGVKSNEIFVAYILSESSLFVYKKHIIIKTCGTTTVLEMLPSLVTTASTIGCSYKYLRYSRSNFMFPHKQEYPHESFQRETEYLDKEFEGLAYVLGPARAARWHLYDAAKPRHKDTEVTLEIVMFDLDRRVMRIFKDEVADGEPRRCTEQSGITTLLPEDALIHEYVFDPCGYSMNALFDNTYWTIHITPESIGSFVSFETNLIVPDYGDLLKRVIRLFGPERFSVVVAHKDGLKDHPKYPSSYDKYTRMNWTRTVTSSDLSMSLQTFRIDTSS